MRSRIPAAAALVLALHAAVPALAQDDATFIQRANDLYRGPDRAVPDARRSDLILAPLIGAMSPPPKGVDTPLRAALAVPGSPVWAEASAWASASSQQGVLDAIRRVGEPSPPGRNFAFLLPYGRDAAPSAARDAGLVVSLGEPPVLAAARFEYLDALTRVASLVNVEATRLAHENKANDAAALLVRWALVCRQIADREFFAEKRWGVLHTVAALERLRDVAHEYGEQFTGQQLAEVIRSISEDYVGAERLQIPRANLLAGEQVLARAFVERQGPGDAFGSTLARASAGDRPLRLFGEAGRWQDLASKHATTFETGDQLRGVFRDWEYRWRLPEFDRVRSTPTDYVRMNKEKFAAVNAVAEGVQEMFDLRQRLRAEAEATRLSLGVVGFHRENSVFPPSLAAVRPRFVATIGADPFSTTRQDFHYFVPIRDQPRGPRDLPKPHEVSVGLPEALAQTVSSEAGEEPAEKAQEAPKAGTFVARLDDSTFVLYAAGPDQQRQWATLVGDGGRDVLYWPPLISLVRDAVSPAATADLPLEWVWPAVSAPTPSSGGGPS